MINEYYLYCNYLQLMQIIAGNILQYQVSAIPYFFIL